MSLLKGAEGNDVPIVSRSQSKVIFIGHSYTLDLAEEHVDFLFNLSTVVVNQQDLAVAETH